VTAPSPTPVAELGRRAAAAARLLAGASTAAKDAALLAAAELLEQRARDLVAANAADLEAAAADGMEAAPLDRLRLTEARIAGMAGGLRQVATLPDPVGEVLDGWRRPNGLEIQRVRVPLGVVAIIYENRPNVTSDAAGLCLKSGNAALLRGSGTALRSNLAIAAVLREGFAKGGLPEDALVLVDDPSHESAVEVMQLRESVDCLIPRGGAALIASIRENATVPVVIDGDGNCQIYVDEHADLGRAVDIVVNANAITKGFDDRLLIEDLTFLLPPGGIVGVIGPNGAGKTTMMDVITGKTRPDTGTAFFGQTIDLTRLSEPEIAGAGIGRKFQKPTVFEKHTVFENLELARKADKRVWPTMRSRLDSAARDHIAATLETIKLMHESGRPAGMLSHGQKQWLEIGMLLMQEPQLLLLDEPVAGMTDDETMRSADLFLSLAGKYTLIVVEHDMDFVERIAEKVTVLHEGSVLAEGSMAQIQQNEQVIEVFLGR